VAHRDAEHAQRLRQLDDAHQAEKVEVDIGTVSRQEPKNFHNAKGGHHEVQAVHPGPPKSSAQPQDPQASVSNVEAGEDGVAEVEDFPPDLHAHPESVSEAVDLSALHLHRPGHPQHVRNEDPGHETLVRSRDEEILAAFGARWSIRLAGGEPRLVLDVSHLLVFLFIPCFEDRVRIHERGL